MDSLPTEILVQILDDAELEVEDLAALSKVSRRWHQAVIPNLYKRYTLRYPDELHAAGRKKLESFQKYGSHVKHLNLHITQWNKRGEGLIEGELQKDNAEADIYNYLDILHSFPEVTTVEHYDMHLRDINWSEFWAILNHFLSKKRKLTSLIIRRRLSYSSRPCAEGDLEPVELHPTPPLQQLKRFSLRINTPTGGSDNLTSFPFFYENFVRVVGNSCKRVTKLELFLNIFELAKSEKLEDLWGMQFPLLPVDNVKELSYEVLPGAIPPPNLIDTDFSQVEVLRGPYWVCGRWLDWALPAVPDLQIFQKLRVLEVTDQPYASRDKDFWNLIEKVVRQLPSVKFLVLEEEELRFEVARKPDGCPVWVERPYLLL
ncbi:hypothetical protein H072_10036 [Dactylellina haptotyla CBS 200.50]|uniref:F-box domain-containing protein n=1 Tax=Dactylellina haptotyla (strain CBS 200.50) TaxID=1284197 RepID=S8A5S0_DACHA|nr:hypothetical protein H072_10036 [Dactylellina haptotyla CBS 200.50]